MKAGYFLAAAVSGICFMTACQRSPEIGGYTIKDAIEYKIRPFPLKDVRLKSYGIFRHAMNKDKEWLLDLEPDRLLSRYLVKAGLEPKAEGYGGWELMAVSGHSLGHYLSACSMLYATDGDIRFKERVDYIVGELKRCQDARGTGYVGAMPEEDRIWKEISEGDIRTDGADLNGGWVPWYTVHKLWAGLIDAVKYTGNSQALEIVTALSDWAVKSFGHLTKEQFQYMMKSEFGGMNESFAEMYALTGNEDYLMMARNFHHEAVLNPLKEGKDSLAGLHSNTQVPKIIGEARMYELTGDPSEARLAEFYWDSMANHHSYTNGGNSNHERISKRDSLNNELSEYTSETCNTYNMLKLTGHLFSWTGDEHYMNYYERAMFNHILASQNPENGMVCYSVSLVQGGHKVFSTPFDSFWCCVGTGMENHTKYAENVFSESVADKGLYVNLFVPAELNWKDKGIKVSMDTDFPYSDTVKVSFEGKKRRFPVYLRCPSWVDGSMSVSVNGNDVRSCQNRGSYMKIDGRWGTGDVIEIVLPMYVRTESMPDNPARQSIFYGPILLAAPLGNGEIKQSDWPVFESAEGSAAEKVTLADRQTLEFEAETEQNSRQRLVPFFGLYDQKYSVYFDVR